MDVDLIIRGTEFLLFEVEYLLRLTQLFWWALAHCSHKSVPVYEFHILLVTLGWLKRDSSLEHPKRPDDNGWNTGCTFDEGPNRGWGVPASVACFIEWHCSYPTDSRGTSEGCGVLQVCFCCLLSLSWQSLTVAFSIKDMSDRAVLWDPQSICPPAWSNSLNFSFRCRW